MSKLIKVTSVTLTLPVTYLLQVDNSSGIIGNDYLADLTGNLYRVSVVNNATHITVVDDVAPLAPYGAPSVGGGSVYTPTASLKLSQMPFDAPGWDDVIRRDMRVLDAGGAGGGGGSGWLSITDVAVTGGGTASNKTYADPPNNTIIQTATVSGLNINVDVKSSAPNVVVAGTSATLSPAGGGAFYQGTVAIVITGTSTITAHLLTPDGSVGASDNVLLTYQPAPSILTLAFTGGYPGAQTELKAGDTFQVAGTTDVPAVGVQVQAFGAGISQSISFASATSFTVTITIADQGNVLQALTAQMRAVDANSAVGAVATTSNTVNVNNLHPTVTFGAKTYPASQSALKASETADVAVTLTNLDTVLFTSPNGDLSIAAPSTISASKTVTRIAGSYNVATNNLTATATRAANGAVTATSTVVAIANVAPTVDISLPAARLRSGGNDGTTVQGHVVTVTSNQQLSAAPSIVAGAGAFIGGAFAGGPTVWTRTLNVHDNDTKGTYSFSTLVAVGLSGLTQNTINSGASYVLGGFVSRNITFSAFSQSATLNVGVVTYSKLTAGTFTATGAAAVRNPVQGDVSNITNNFTVTTLANVGPITLFWNDAAAASTNSSGTAQLLSVQESV